MTQLIDYLKWHRTGFLLIGLLCLWSCGSSNNNNIQEVDSLTEIDSDKQTPPTDSVASRKQRNPGEIPLAFPVVNTTAKAGEYVLAPMLQWIEDGFAKGKDQMVLIFHSREMIAPGEAESKLKSIGKEASIPNSMIIPIPKGEKASQGDVVLTWEQSRGSSMRTAIVTEAVNPASPKIQYLDTPYLKDTPPDQAKPNTFVVLRRPWQAGSYLAVKEDVGHNYAQIIRLEGEKVLTIGFTGKVKVYHKNECVPIPIRPDVKPGDKVHIVRIAAFIEGVVQKVDYTIGRVFVKTEFGGKPEIVVVGYGKIIKDLKIK